MYVNYGHVNYMISQDVLQNKINLSIWRKELRISFIYVKMQNCVESYQCDIVAKGNHNKDKFVIIEKQLERSDYDYLEFSISSS